MSENAEMPYQPNDDQTPPGGIQAALAKVESMMSNWSGVKGAGLTKTAANQDAIIVFVENAETSSQLPSSVDGYSVIGEITGDITAY